MMPAVVGLMLYKRFTDPILGLKDVNKRIININNNLEIEILKLQNKEKDPNTLKNKIKQLKSKAKEKLAKLKNDGVYFYHKIGDKDKRGTQLRKTFKSLYEGANHIRNYILESFQKRITEENQYDDDDFFGPPPTPIKGPLKDGG